MKGRILVQGTMRPRCIVVARIGSKDPVQVRRAQGDDVIDALATDRSDQRATKSRSAKLTRATEKEYPEYKRRRHRTSTTMKEPASAKVIE